MVTELREELRKAREAAQLLKEAIEAEKRSEERRVGKECLE